MKRKHVEWLIAFVLGGFFFMPVWKFATGLVKR